MQQRCSAVAKKEVIHSNEKEARQSKFHLMLRKKLVQERRENAEKKKTADQGSEPDNRITQNALPEETPIVASPPVYQDIYSRVPMLPMLPLPIFYNGADDASGQQEIEGQVAEFEDAAKQEGFYPEEEQDEDADNQQFEDEGSQEYEDSGSGTEAEDIYDDAKGIEEEENQKSGFYGGSEAANRDDMAAGAGADQNTEAQKSGTQEAAAGQAAAGQGAAGQAAAGQGAGQQQQKGQQSAAEDNKGDT